ncbi:MAG: LysR substrate-binding domain-containing protein [Caulobacter sp.]|nr:LysR substrate-binding domain-containing protein [Caulobacter sp.]
MTLAQLASFVRIVELGSFSRAAASLRIAQPALSRQVRALEEELDARLLERHARGVTPTEAGETLFEHARLILRGATDARSAVTALSAEPAGVVALGAPSSLATALLPVLAQRIQARYPRLRLHLIDGFSATLHQWALSGRLDLAILYQDAAMGPLPNRPLLVEDLVAVGPAGHFAPNQAVTPTDLAGSPLVMPARPHRLRLLIEGWSPRCYARMEVDSLPALLDLVRTGFGCTVLAYSTIHAAVTEGRLSYAPLAPKLTRTLVLARPPQRRPSAAQTAVETEIIALVAEEADRLRWSVLGPPP